MPFAVIIPIILSITLPTLTLTTKTNLQECLKMYNPSNYLSHLPSLKLPYIGDIPMPVNVNIKPTPAVKTKVVKVVTKYVYKNPVCVKYVKGKRMCGREGGFRDKTVGDVDKLVTKEYFVGEMENRIGREGDNFLQSSETSRPFTAESETPNLPKNHKVYDILIEDRLDQLETILPHYTRRRTYETSTITVTKVLSNRRTMATLLVKNCIPQGYKVCEIKNKKRMSKVAKVPDRVDDESFYYG